jgi:hypothetical protein
MRTNWHIWSGVKRPYIKLTGRRGPYLQYFPTVVIDVNLADWALPLSVHVGGPLLGKLGLTFRVGPVNIGWSRL